MKHITVVVLCLLISSYIYSSVIIDKENDGYIACIPEIADKTTKMPVLVVLPGLHVSAKNELNMWKFNAQKKGFLTIAIYVDYPKLKTWVEVEELHQRIISTLNIFISDKNNYSICSDKIYIAGTSAGGMMALRLSLMYPEQFKATIAVSGSNLYLWHANEFLHNAKGLKFYLMHGRKDNIVPIKNFYETKTALEKHGAIIETYINEQAGHIMNSKDYKRAMDWLSELQ